MTPYERGYAAGLKAAAGVVATNKIGDELAYGSVTQAWLERAILSLPIQGETQPTHPSAKPFKCPHCGSHYFGPTFRGKEIAGRYCKGWPSGYDRSYNPCPAKHVEWYEQADQRGTANGAGGSQLAAAQTLGSAERTGDRQNDSAQSVPHHNPGEQELPAANSARRDEGNPNAAGTPSLLTSAQQPASPGPCVVVPKPKICLDCGAVFDRHEEHTCAP